MKKNIICATLVIVLIANLICAGFAFLVKDNYKYEASAVVAEINPATGWATLVDWQGEAWCCEQEGLEEGQLVIIVFDNMRTEDIYDDEIIEVRVG